MRRKNIFQNECSSLKMHQAPHQPPTLDKASATKRLKTSGHRHFQYPCPIKNIVRITNAVQVTHCIGCQSLTFNVMISVPQFVWNSQ